MWERVSWVWYLATGYIQLWFISLLTHNSLVHWMHGHTPYFSLWIMFLICEHSQPFSLHSFLSQTPDNSLTYTHVHLFTRKHFIFLPHTHTHNLHAAVCALPAKLFPVAELLFCEQHSKSNNLWRRNLEDTDVTKIYLFSHTVVFFFYAWIWDDFWFDKR